MNPSNTGLRALAPLAPLFTLLALAPSCVANAAGGDPSSEGVATLTQSDSLSGSCYMLDWHGGTGGDRTMGLGCGNGVAVGIWGSTTQRRYTDPYDFIQSFGLICETFDAKGHLQPPWTDLTGGPNGSFGYHLLCPAGEVMVGLGGNSGTYVDYVGPICQPLARIRDPNETGRHWWPGAGGYGGNPFQDPCLAGYAITGGVVHSGGFVDSVQLECDFISP